ncbi:TPA: hypothetical protein ACPZJO_000226 [Yersinia enterocolitica]|uniref:hypothetical protein n=1 Tax=Yersinia enterocolitica TaxID=630 RepID=UPI0038429C7F
MPTDDHFGWEISANRLMTHYIIACNHLFLIYLNSHHWLMATKSFYYDFLAIFDIVATLNNEGITMISGPDGGNFILSSMAKERVKSGILDRAVIEGSKGGYTVVLDGSEWEGKSLFLSSSRQPYEARVFKSIDGAVAELMRIGLSEASIKNTTKSNAK